MSMLKYVMTFCEYVNHVREVLFCHHKQTDKKNLLTDYFEEFSFEWIPVEVLFDKPVVPKSDSLATSLQVTIFSFLNAFFSETSFTIDSPGFLLPPHFLLSLTLSEYFSVLGIFYLVGLPKISFLQQPSSFFFFIKQKQICFNRCHDFYVWYFFKI